MIAEIVSDKMVGVQVVEKCRRGRYQPLLLLFAVPEGSPIDTSAAPKAVTRVTKPQLTAVTTQPLRRSLTPSPEKPTGLGLATQRRAVTPNPDQTQHEPTLKPMVRVTNKDTCYGYLVFLIFEWLNNVLVVTVVSFK